jgi:hypothetical protein
MPNYRNWARAVSSRIDVLLLAIFLASFTQFAAAGSHRGTLQGTVQSGDQGLPQYRVSLYGAFIDHGPAWMQLGSATSDNSGHFRIDYSVPPGLLGDNQPVFLVEATKGRSMLASAIGIGSGAPDTVVVNERTTVATANTYAQFIGSTKIQGNYYGMKNGVGMAANLADPVTGAAGVVLSMTPNGTETSTYATFNSLTNVVAGCVADSTICARLITAATPAGQPAPANVLQALSNIVKNPSFPGYPHDEDDPLFVLSLAHPVYQPVLEHRPTSWLIFLKITGGFYSQQDADNLIDGPGNFAIDEKGFVWVNDNYIPQPPDHFACAGTRAIKFEPSGAPVPGTPFFGGGLSGAGWGAAIDINGDTWISNFGFQDPPCQDLPENAPHNAVSKFRSDGTAISPAEGFTAGNIAWPMGIISDRSGNIWTANCNNDTVTRYRRGDPNRSSIVLLGPPPAPDDPQIKPFGLVADLGGNIWTTNVRSNSVSIISPQGRLIKTIPGTYQGKTIITHPIANAADSHGNIWIANSDYLDTPCPDGNMRGPAENPSVTLFLGNTREPHPGSPFTGGGLTLPWGVAVDGYDTVWVFNFGAVPVGEFTDTPTGISHFCGTDTRQCPAGLHVGDPISPSTGYRSDALARITGGAIDPSGNIWLTSNWKIDADPVMNPGGNSVVIAIGAAVPIKTPLIGPPVPFR